MEIPASFSEECERILNRYPFSEGALLPVLQLAQRQLGYIPEPMVRHIAQLLGAPPARVSGAISFFPGLRTQPEGAHRIAVCSSLPCSLTGAGEVIDYLRDRLGIDVGESTADGRFTLAEVACLGSCGTGPAMMVDGELHQSLTRERIDQLLESLAD